MTRCSAQGALYSFRKLSVQSTSTRWYSTQDIGNKVFHARCSSAPAQGACHTRRLPHKVLATMFLPHKVLATCGVCHTRHLPHEALVTQGDCHIRHLPHKALSTPGMFHTSGGPHKVFHTKLYLAYALQNGVGIPHDGIIYTTLCLLICSGSKPKKNPG